MSLAPASAFAVLIGSAVGAEWVADRLGVPSILPLLVVGFLLGPVSGLVAPDALLGDSLFPLISIAVAIILFEGGMNLRVSNLRPVVRPVVLLTAVGTATTVVAAALLAWWILELDPEVALLLGAVLVVTGPTVIVPLFREMNVGGDLKTVAMWEGIINDPLGAVLTVSVYELAVSGRAGPAMVDAVSTLSFTIVVGIALAVTGAALLVVAVARGWVPEFLQSPITLAAVVAVFASGEALSPEAGLIATTGMGVIVANQDYVEMRRAAKFKETLGLILVSVLFVTLAARFEWASFREISLQSVIFLALLIFVVRPAAVLLAGIPGGLKWREMVALMFVAPRGIVAAALGSLFSIKLLHTGHPEARYLDGTVIFVVAGTVLFYGLLADPVISRLDLEGVDDASEPP